MDNGSAELKLAPLEEVARYLSFSSDSSMALNALRKLTRRQWLRVLRWLDDSGLVFYFLQKLKDLGATDVVPPSTLSKLEQDLASNQLRVENMSRSFAALNTKFEEAGIRYVVVKGFSLVPDFCPSAGLRHQGDFDYLVQSESLPKARRIVIEAGYAPKQSRSSKEDIFVTPGGEPSRYSAKYLPQSPHAVELHADMWDSGLHGVPELADLFSVEGAITRRWNGLTFPSLAEEDAFILQVTHACHHLFTLWIRMSCLFEIAYFLDQRACDGEFWARVDKRVGDRAVLREFVVIVSELAARLFAAPLPPLVETWSAHLRPGARVWIDHYARHWAFCELPVYELRLFPRSKLALFLRQQYEAPSNVAKSQGEEHAAPKSRLARMASSIRNEPSLALNRGWWRRQLLVRRSIFHALAGARYICEIPRWLWLNRARVRTASS